MVIRSVTDERVYADAPADPSVPSLDQTPESQSSPDIKARAVARKRNGYGLSQGDVVLNTPDTVRSVVRDNVESALKEAGFDVVNSTDVAASRAMEVDVRIRKFWLWLQPGVMVGTIRSRIATDIRFGSEMQVSVEAETSQPGQIFSEAAWTKAVSVATEAYRTQVRNQLSDKR